MDNPADRLYILFQLALGVDGRDRAFTRIWNAYGKRIHFYVSRIISRDAGHHDDCFQEVMLKIYEGLDGYRIDRPLKPWLFRVARNCCLDFLKKRTEEAAENIELVPAAPGRAPEERLICGELFGAVGESIDALSADDAQLAYLRFFEGMRFSEIAKIMEMNENTVKTRMTAIKKKLRHDLKEWL
ncbi:MAG: sigma-70 family RNA polymerase sigma factor [Spirochaetes bacterium]|nr:sigma-70 family RNA polymerase sigma factor [Spirochaetota bacterium]